MLHFVYSVLIKFYRTTGVNKSLAFLFFKQYFQFGCLRLTCSQKKCLTLELHLSEDRSDSMSICLVNLSRRYFSLVLKYTTLESVFYLFTITADFSIFRAESLIVKNSLLQFRHFDTFCLLNCLFLDIFFTDFSLFDCSAFCTNIWKYW